MKATVWIGLVVVLASTAAACGGGVPTGMPSGDHLHSLAVTADGGLLLGLHGGLFRSGDGTTWDLVGLEGQDAMVIASAATPLFVAGHDVLARSDDGGETFQQLRPPDLPGLDIHAFAQAPADGRTLYALVVGFGLFASADAGETWEERARPEDLPPDVFGLGVAGSGTGTVVMVGPENGIFRSEDGGRSLTRVLGVPSWAVTVDRNDPSRVWALSAEGLMVSEDVGATWETASTLPGVEGQPLALASGIEDLWLISEEPRTLYRSSDGGGTWDSVGS